MLCAGVGAASDVDVHGLIQFNPLLQCLMSSSAWPFVFDCANVQYEISCAGDDAVGEMDCFVAKPAFSKAFSRRHERVGHGGNDEILQTVRRISPLP